GVGARATTGATTERWIPHVAATRRPDFAAGQGFDDELLLRVELMPGAKRRLPSLVSGPAAARLASGRMVARRRAHFVNHRPVEIDVVQVGQQYVLDELLEGSRVARIGLPGFRAGGKIITLEVEPDTSVPDNVYVYL